jgi:ribose 5-phosphate isomerase
MARIQTSTESPSQERSRRQEQGYTITGTGNVVVDVDRLLRSQKALEIARKARTIVERNERPVR